MPKRDGLHTQQSSEALGLYDLQKRLNKTKLNALASNDNIASRSTKVRVVQNAVIDTFDMNGTSSKTYDGLDR